MSIAGMNFALTPDQVTGFQQRTETINGRAAMVGFVAAMGAELTGHSVAEQVFSPAASSPPLSSALPPSPPPSPPSPSTR